MKTPSAAERVFLEEGAGSYAAAVSAIVAFRELVQCRCRQIVQKQLPNYSAALGVPVDKSHLLGVDAPRLTQWEGDWAWLGVNIRGLGDADVTFYHGLYWELNEGGAWSVQVGAGIWLSKRDQLEPLWEALRPHPQELTREDSREIWLSEPLTYAEVPDFDQKLDPILGRWIALWERVGGLKVLGAPADQSRQ